MRNKMSLNGGGQPGVVGLLAPYAVRDNELIPDGIDSPLVSQHAKQPAQYAQFCVSIQWAHAETVVGDWACCDRPEFVQNLGTIVNSCPCWRNKSMAVTLG